MRLQRISPACAENSLLRFTDLGIQVIPTSDLLGTALKIATDFDCSFYDSLYVALALATQPSSSPPTSA